ncbi:MAG: DUF4065 domain-containing protein [Bacilli bacterium]|nr:DUF4065 domain-containing protein [Bacilli bacterium]MDD4718860.1 DUF4065 domain-containing protein [Bacilli bacterium]
MKKEKNIKIRKASYNVKGINIEYDEKYCIDPITNEELFDREIEIENDTVAYDIYRKQKGLLMSSEIKEIRTAYNLNQKEFSVSIGLGEITIHRLENGMVQTESIDSIIRLAKEPSNMYNLVVKNSDKLSDECFINTTNILKRKLELKKHHIAECCSIDLNELNFEKASVFDISDLVISKYNQIRKKIGEQYCIDPVYITNLKLQKLLYYIQGISLAVFGEKAFDSRISAWDYGPVVDEIYHIHSAGGKDPILDPEEVPNLSPGINAIIDLVIDSYGQIEATKLIDITHEEDPWRDTARYQEIKSEKIEDYFKKVYIINN